MCGNPPSKTLGVKIRKPAFWVLILKGLHLVSKCCIICIRSLKMLPKETDMKRLFKYVLLATLFLVILGVKRDTVLADSAVITNQNDGTVKLVYQNDYSTKVKLLVQLTGGKQYKYDIPRGEVNIYIPLTQGNGTYRLILCRNIAGTRYAILQTVSVNQSLSDSTEAFLSSNYMLNWDETNAAIKKAQSLAKKGNKIKNIYDYVVRNYSYDTSKAKNISSLTKDAAYIPNISKIYKSKKGICYDYSVLLASMLRSVGVPTKVVTGYTPNIAVYHAWNNIYDNSKWNVADATYDAELYRVGRKYSMYKKYSQYKDVVYTY